MITQTRSLLRAPSDEYVQGIIRTHFDPAEGTPYWIDRDARLGAQAITNVQTLADLKRIVGFHSLAEQEQFERDTRFLPLEQFIPRRILASGRPIWASETGGTTGSPKHGNWDGHYWDQILGFSDEFLDLHGVPRARNWLFIGPMGPHTTGRLIVSIAEHRGGRCFSIDLDPRIVKIFIAENYSAAYERYIKHIWDQVEGIIRYQNIGIVFCTSRLLEMLPEHLDPLLFERVAAIVHAGTTMEPATDRLLRQDVFPNSRLVGLYGTSTTGISYQKPIEPADANRVIYIPSSPYIHFEVVDEAGREVDYGEEGRVVVYRLTEDSLIPGFWERDRAVKVKPFGAVAERYPWSWLGDPFSPEFTVEGKAEGVY